MTNLSDWQLIQIIITIVGSAVGPTAWITWRLSKVTTDVNNLKKSEIDNEKNRIETEVIKTEVDNLKEKVKKVDDELTYIVRLDQQESHADVRRLRSKLYDSSRKKAMEDEGEG